MKFRQLTTEEIQILSQQNCTAQNWKKIKVAIDFTPQYIHHVQFSGDIQLGVFHEEFILDGGLSKHSGLWHVTLHNCTVGNHVFIENIPNYIANYEICDHAFIQNVNLIVTEEKNAFGNGILVSVLNETGGREVPVFNTLSAHLAYIIALYRHSPVLTEQLKKLIEKYTAGNLLLKGKDWPACPHPQHGHDP